MHRSLRAGDTWTWTDSLGNYPASQWTLTYTFYSAESVFSLTGVPDGDDHLISAAPAVTAAYPPGSYNYTARVFDGTDRYEVSRGTLRVEPNVTDEPVDGRTHARRMLDLIEIALEGKATRKQLDVVMADLAARRIQYSIESLVKMRQLYGEEVAAQERAKGNLPGFVQWRFD